MAAGISVVRVPGRYRSSHRSAPSALPRRDIPKRLARAINHGFLRRFLGMVITLLFTFSVEPGVVMGEEFPFELFIVSAAVGSTRWPRRGFERLGDAGTRG